MQCHSGAACHSILLVFHQCSDFRMTETESRGDRQGGWVGKGTEDEEDKRRVVS